MSQENAVLGNKRVTIRDVAKQASVSPSTVSRVLTGSSTQIPISEKTRVRVKQVATDLGYRPHPSARALSGKSTGLLGVIVRELDDPFFAQLTEVLSNVAKEKGYDLVLGNAKREPEIALALRERMLDLGYCDGLLLCGDLRESSEDRSFLAKMGGNHQVVSVACGSEQLARSIPSVGVDNRSGTVQALEHLLDLGHRRIACLDAGRGGDLWDRLTAFRHFMVESFGGVPEDYVQQADNSCRGGYEATKRLLSLASPPSAIFAMDDMMAIGALAAAADATCAVPGRLSIVGFDDLDVSGFVRPALTTLRQPMELIGRQAMELLLNMIRGELSSDPWPTVWLDPVLVVRDSSGPAQGS